MVRICLLVVGEPPPEIRAKLGDYPIIFGDLAKRHAVEMVAVDGRAASVVPTDYAGVVITGSASSLSPGEREPWMDAAVEFTRQCYATATPLLGVCFGHQLIGEAAGSVVVKNPKGWGMSTGSISVSDAGTLDPLFAGLGRQLAVNFSHSDIVDADRLPADVTVLASNRKARVQAIAWGPVVRGIQFHPEFTADFLRPLIGLREDTLRADAAARGCPGDEPNALLARARNSTDGVAVFDNFIEHFVFGS